LTWTDLLWTPQKTSITVDHGFTKGASEVLFGNFPDAINNQVVYSCSNESSASSTNGVVFDKISTAAGLMMAYKQPVWARCMNVATEVADVVTYLLKDA